MNRSKPHRQSSISFRSRFCRTTSPPVPVVAACKLDRHPVRSTKRRNFFLAPKWCDLMRHGLSFGPAVIYQDSQSPICLAKKGRSTSERCRRNQEVRNFLIAHYIQEGEVLLEYWPTGEMIADLWTKPLNGHFMGSYWGMRTLQLLSTIQLQLKKSRTDHF